MMTLRLESLRFTEHKPLLLGLLAALATLLSAGGAHAQCANPVECENLFAGTTAWRIDGPVSDDATGQIQGYASDTSVDTGGSIDFHVTVAGGASWTVDVFRMGWYSGDGGRLMLQAGPLAGTAQPSCPATLGTNGSVECSWSVGYTLNVPTDWVSGIYLAKLETLSTGHQAYIMFVVREDARVATYLYQQAAMTYQSYNRYPVNGHSVSFYNGGSGVQAWEKRLSFDRPYTSSTFLRNNQSPFSTLGDGSGGFFTWDFPMILWLESEGYDISYASNVDLHVTTDLLLSYRAMLSVGHDEYWTEEMATAASDARDAGVNLGFFAGNHVFGTVEMQPASDSTPNRIMEGITKAGAPGVDPGHWDHPNYPDKIKRQLLLGQANTGCCVRKPISYYNVDWIVDVAEHWVFEGTGFLDGDAVPGLLGYEPDAYDPDPTFQTPDNLHFTLLSASPFTPAAAGAPGDTSYLNSWPLDFAHSVIYQAPSGAWVFSAGTTDWPWGLATPFSSGLPPYDPASGNGLPTSQSFMAGLNGTGSGTWIANDLGQPAWEANGTGGRASWVRGAEGSQAQGLVDGYTLTTVFRMVSGVFITNYYADGQWRFLPFVKLSGADLVVEFESTSGTLGPFVLASGASATDYHTHEVRYDASSGQASYYFDGGFVVTWSGAASSQRGLYFGQGSTQRPTR